MLPQTPYAPNDPVPHESINDLPVHYATKKQIFHPVAESRHFSRSDAAQVFERGLLPAEDRIPHPELYDLEKWRREGVVPAERISRQREKNEEDAKRREKLQRLKEEKERLTVKRIETPRWEFKFQDIDTEIVGKDERDHRGVGARYGMPHEDRKKGQIKIPKKVVV